LNFFRRHVFDVAIRSSSRGRTSQATGQCVRRKTSRIRTDIPELPEGKAGMETCRVATANERQ
jgi:hypothetical protein